MKKLLSTIIAASCLSCAVVQAAEPQAQFINSEGLLIIPHLNLGNDIYYVQLNRTNAGYNFSLSAATKVTPAVGDDWATADEILGEWTLEDMPGLTISIGADGSYELDHPAEDDCAAGVESGVYGYSEDTGVFSVRISADANGDCGLSHPDGAYRMERDGTDLLVTIYEDDMPDRASDSTLIVLIVVRPSA